MRRALCAAEPGRRGATDWLDLALGPHRPPRAHHPARQWPHYKKRKKENIIIKKRKKEKRKKKRNEKRTNTQRRKEEQWSGWTQEQNGRETADNISELFNAARELVGWLLILSVSASSSSCFLCYSCFLSPPPPPSSSSSSSLCYSTFIPRV